MNTRLEYEITVEDHVAKLDRFVGQSPVGRNFTWLAYCGIIALAWLSAVLFYIKQGDQNYGYIVSGLFALALTLSLPSLYRWYQKSFWASVFTQAAVQGLIGRKVLVLGDQFIEEAGDVQAVRVHWRDVQKVESDPQRTWLIIAPLIMIIIPNSAFDSTVEQELFQRECEHQITSYPRSTDQGDQAERR